ncbi:MAG: transposase [Blastocatellales bacterium]|nr:transposase [Blastocatellales bacterium]
MFGLYSLVALLTYALHPDGNVPIRQTAWYQKQEATFADALATVRRHLCSRFLVNNYGAIFVENLNIKGLASGMLAKSVNDAAWGGFLNKTSYKALNAGRVYGEVYAPGTSQECLCGAEVPKTLSDRWHHCKSCGLSEPRDHVPNVRHFEVKQTASHRDQEVVGVEVN